STAGVPCFRGPVPKPRPVWTPRKHESSRGTHAFAAALHQQLAQRFVDALRIGKGGYLPMGCDGSRLECPRSQQLQARLGEAGKTDSPPMAYVSALVLLPLALCCGRGGWAKARTANTIICVPCWARCPRGP